MNWQEICETDEEYNIERIEILREPQESRCYQAILQPGSFLRIKAPQYMGKTRMLLRVLERVKKNDCQIVVLNFQNQLDSTAFFCDLLRGWHSEAQRDELWQKLRLVIVHSTDVYASLNIIEAISNAIATTDEIGLALSQDIL